MRTKEDRRFQIIGNTVMILLTIAALFPMILLLISSLTDNDTLIRNGYSIFPEKWSLEGYSYVFATGNSVINAYGISVILTLIGTSLSLIVTTLLGYALSKKKLPLRGIMTFYVFFTMLFNGGLAPTYINYAVRFGFKNTFWGLLIPNLVTNGFYILLMKSYFTTSVPEEILEAAYIDGANEFATFFKVALPLGKPIIVTIGMFAGIAYWNDWMNGYIYITTKTELYSIQNLLNRMMQNIQFLTNNGSSVKDAALGIAKIPSVSVRMSMAVLGILPIIIVYPMIQRNFVKGITLGGVKG